MLSLLMDINFWISLFSVTLVQIALGADNLIIITIIANKLPVEQRTRAINIGLILAMLFRILLLGMVSLILRYATAEFYHFDWRVLGWFDLSGGLSGKAHLEDGFQIKSGCRAFLSGSRCYN